MVMAKFIVPPENQGQIVEVSYAETPSGIIMRVYDRSDRSEYFRRTPWTDRLIRWSESHGPQNAEPPCRKWSKKLTMKQVEAWLDD